MLLDKIQSEYKKALKEKDSEKISVYRMLLSAIHYFNIEKGKNYHVSDNDIITIIRKEVKKRKEAASLYEKGGREDLKEKEQREISYLLPFMPKMAGKEEIRAMVKEAIENVSARSTKDIGKVIGYVLKKADGKAEGRLVHEVALKLLSEKK